MNAPSGFMAVLLFCIIMLIIMSLHFLTAMILALRSKHPIRLRLRHLFTHLLAITWYVLLASFLGIPQVLIQVLNFPPNVLAVAFIVMCWPSALVFVGKFGSTRSNRPLAPAVKVHHPGPR
jgi:hypothetical protein